MVEWQPVTGILPPLNDAEWQAAFERYQQYPEYRKLNSTMDVDGFKSIFWLEFIHRLWGRTIGVVFALPFLWFWWRGAIDRRLAPKLVVMFVLGGLQGLMGWYMVKSGLVDRPDVSQYRLTAHLALAFLVYGYMLWVALGLLFAGDSRGRRGPHGLAMAVTALAAVTIMSGGLVAGIDAGFIYNTFPLMDGRLVPTACSRWRLWLSTRSRTPPWCSSTTGSWPSPPPWRRPGCGWRPAATASRDAPGWPPIPCSSWSPCRSPWGIATLLTVVAVPLAAAHQAGAMVVFTALLWLVYETGHG